MWASRMATTSPTAAFHPEIRACARPSLCLWLTFLSNPGLCWWTWSINLLRFSFRSSTRILKTDSTLSRSLGLVRTMLFRLQFKITAKPATTFQKISPCLLGFTGFPWVVGQAAVNGCWNCCEFNTLWKKDIWVWKVYWDIKYLQHMFSGVFLFTPETTRIHMIEFISLTSDDWSHIIMTENTPVSFCPN